MFTDVFPVSEAELFDSVQKSQLFSSCPTATAIEYADCTGILNWCVQKYVNTNT